MRRAATIGVLVGAWLLGAAPAAGAHPLGNFTVNRFAEVVVAPARIEVRYVLDLAEIPTFQELQRIDPAGDGPGEDELRRWGDQVAATTALGAVLNIDGSRVPLRVESAVATTRSGEGGLPTLRLEASMSGPLGLDAGSLTFEDRNDPERLGWREIIANGADGIALVASTAPSVSATDRLRSYPEDLLSDPLTVTSMEARFRLGGDVGVRSEAPASSAGSSRPLRAVGSFALLLDRQGTVLMLLGALAALAFGAWHALLPGHGKTLMAAAMVGSGARTRQAVVAAASVAAMHSLSVIALALLVVVLEHGFRPEAVYPWIRVLSGLVAVGVGVHLVRARWRSRGDGSRRIAVEERFHGDGHGHAGHVHEAPSGDLLSRRGIVALAFAGGLLPSPSALLVLLAALQRGRAAYGLGLVLAFSAGMASSLVVVALGATRARRMVGRRRWAWAGSLLSLCSAIGIVVIGLCVSGAGLVSL